MEVNYKIIRVNQSLSVKLDIKLTTIIESGFISITKKLKNISPISTNHGIIKDNKVFLKNIKNLEIFIPYVYDDIEVIFSYFTKNDILLSESKIIKIENIQVKELQEATKELNNNSIKNHYNFSKISQWLSFENTFGWKAILESKEDVKIRFIKKGQPATFCIGENSYEVISSDYFFDIQEDQKELNIPINLIEKLINKKVACFILCKGDFYNIDNLYYKIPVSNFVEIPTSEHSTAVFDPLGNLFNG